MKTFLSYCNLIKEETAEERLRGLNNLAHPHHDHVKELIHEIGMLGTKAENLLAKVNPQLAKYVSAELINIRSHIEQYTQ